MGRRSAIILCLSVAALVIVGLVMLASTGAWTNTGGEDRYFALKRQVFWTGVGLVTAISVGLMDYRLLQRFWLPILGGACVLLLLCYVPGIQQEHNGEFRWIKLPLLGQFQPSEVAKIAIIIGLAAWFAQYQAEVRSFWRGFAMPIMILGVPALLILFEKDMGTTAAIGAAGFGLMFVAGTRWWLLGITASSAIGALAFLVRMDPERMGRIMSFMDPEGTKLGAGWQQYLALLAFGSGGIQGKGIGNGVIKHDLPFAHTDFIFPMVGEELGMIASLTLVFCFVLITVTGISIALHTEDLFGKLLGFGLTAVIVIPAMMNMGVATAVLPNTGLPLPFVSYGGTNLVFTLAAVGMLVSLHRRACSLERVEMPVIKERKLAIKI